MAQNKAAKIDSTRNNDKARDTEQAIQIKKMMRYPPSLNGINKNLP
ncbi:hypothetical protein [Cohnella sp.]